MEPCTKGEPTTKKSEIKALHTTRKLREKPSCGVAITPSHRSIKCQPKGKAPNFKENALKAMGKKKT